MSSTADMHTHYQHVHSTLYPETRKRLAASHAARADLDYSSPGWVVGAAEREREAIAAASMSQTAQPVATEVSVDGVPSPK